MSIRLLAGLALLIAPSAYAQDDPRDAYRGELRLGGMLLSGSGNHVAGAGAPEALTGGGGGLELLARVDGVGILLRSMSATPAVGGGPEVDLGSREARLLLGTRRLSGEFGLLQRTVPGSGSDELESFGRVGLRAQWELGGSGLDVSLGAGAHFSKGDGENGTQLTYRGHDAEVALLYKFIQRYRVPAFAAIGWRLTTIDEKELPQAVSLTHSGPFLSAGFRLGN